MNWTIDKILDPILNIGAFEYTKIIKYLKYKFPYCSYYRDIYEYIRNKNLKKLNQSEMSDKIINEYIKCRPNIKVIILYPSIEDIKKLESYGTICYIKELKMTYKMMYNLLYQIYATTDKMKTDYEIAGTLKELNLTEDTTIKIIVFEKEKEIELENFFETNVRINKTFNDAIDFANIFFNINSINFLEKQNCREFLDFKKNQSDLLILKKKLYNLSIVEQYKFLITSGTILSIYGVRKFKDIDMYATDDININSNNYKSLFGPYDIISVLDKESWSVWEDEIKSRLKLFTKYDSFNEFIVDPKNSFYFCGLKFLRLKYVIPFRALYIRKNPARMIDLIMLKKLLNLNFLLSFELKKDIDDKFLHTMKQKFKYKYNLDLSDDEIHKMINTLFYND